MKSGKAKLVNFILIISLLGIFPGGFVGMCVENTTQRSNEAAQPADTKPVDIDNGICPVTGEKIMKGTHVISLYGGKIYHFCCDDCPDEFNKDPQKYVSRIKDFNIEAYQFAYSPDKIVVKKGDIVRLFATSRDVRHGIRIQDYDINVPVEKGKVTKIEFLAGKAGNFEITCSVYCGSGHHGMKGHLIVEE